MNLTSQFEAFTDAILSGRQFEGYPTGSDSFLKAVGAGSARVALVMDPRGWYREISSPVHEFGLDRCRWFWHLSESSRVLVDGSAGWTNPGGW